MSGTFKAMKMTLEEYLEDETMDQDCRSTVDQIMKEQKGMSPLMS